MARKLSRTTFLNKQLSVLYYFLSVRFDVILVVPRGFVSYSVNLRAIKGPLKQPEIIKIRRAIKGRVPKKGQIINVLWISVLPPPPLSTLAKLIKLKLRIFFYPLSLTPSPFAFCLDIIRLLCKSDFNQRFYVT